MNRTDVVNKINSSTYKIDSVPDRVNKLILSGEFKVPLNSADLCELLNEMVGTKVKSKDLSAQLKPLLVDGIINATYSKNGRFKKRVWFPSWIKKEGVKEKVTTEQGPVELFKRLHLHPELVRVSEKLFRDGSYAPAVFEATKRLNNYVKTKSHIERDGAALMSTVFSKNSPVLKLNQGLTQTELDEQEGYMHLFMGAMLGIRNPKGHENIVLDDSCKALQFLSFISLLFRKVDEAKRS